MLGHKAAIVAALCLLIVLLLRIYQLLPSRSLAKQRRPRGSECSMVIFLGSGGHTSEMKTLLSTLDFHRYRPRTYIYCHGDNLSLKVVSELESSNGGQASSQDYHLLALPRARQVGQSAISSIFSVIKTLAVCIHHIFILPMLQHPTKPFADLLVGNGPGTCVVVIAVSWIRRILGLSFTRIIYVESFARVTSLSLSGKLVRPFVDRFMVQWPEASDTKAEYRGWLV
ncbi:hypothetical protein L204_100390 [Cryptococcus depauperatus]